MRRVIGAALVLAVAACGGSAAQDTRAGAPGAAGAQHPDQVVAEVGDRTITLQEVDDRWQAMDAPERARVMQLLYQNRRNVLDLMVGDALIEDAAKAAGLTAEQYLQQELPKRRQPVTDADIQQFYDANRDRTGGRSLDELRGPVREFLENQREQQARAGLVEELRKKGVATRVLLDPPRQVVELAAHNPTLGPESAPITIVEFSDYQ